VTSEVCANVTTNIFLVRSELGAKSQGTGPQTQIRAAREAGTQIRTASTGAKAVVVVQEAWWSGSAGVTRAGAVAACAGAALSGAKRDQSR
jgi:hypothetical protein